MKHLVELIVKKMGISFPNLNCPNKPIIKLASTGSFILNISKITDIKNHRRGRYTTLLTEGKLNVRLHEIDLEANEMLETIIPRLAAERGIDEDLKARDMPRWAAEMNNIKASAEEIVLREVIYI